MSASPQQHQAIHLRWGRTSYAVAALIGLTGTAPAGDILRGGAVQNARSAPGNSAATAATTAQARANAKDALARTAKSIKFVQDMQRAAQAAAARKGPDNLGADPNHPGQQLPNVPNGLAPGGLQFVSGTGANAPIQSNINGLTNVTIKQTQQQALLNWSSFNIGRNTNLHFDQTAGGASVGQWIAFNKVNDPTGRPSQIIGSITAAGQVYVINQNGIIFGGTSQVNVHTLVASSLPINDNLVERGLLNNPDSQFLFSALPIAAGSKGTPSFTPSAALTPTGNRGDVTVQPGAVLLSPTSVEKVGGRIALIGPNVTNSGTILTPDGQTILAAGLQVGLDAHKSTDPSLRGLDVYVGSVGTYGGTAINRGLIEAHRGNVTIAGKAIRQLGIINSSTSVSLNGRIDLIASYDAVSNPRYDAAIPANGLPYLAKQTGSIEIGPGSVMQILPEWSSTEKVASVKLPLSSQINITGKTIHLAGDSMILAPNANVIISAGVWDFIASVNAPKSSFVNSQGQIYLDPGSTINVAGTTDAEVPLSQSIVKVQLRGSELADSPLQRAGKLRGVDLVLDLRKTGVYNGVTWYGTPLADASGFLNLIERDVSELTTAGGTVKLNAGNSVVVQNGAKIDVSAGWINVGSGYVNTTRVLSHGHIFNISEATPDLIYDGIYDGKFTESHPRWNVTKTYLNPLNLHEHFERPYQHGADGGLLSLTAPGMALDGEFLGTTVNGPRQRSVLAKASTLDISFTAQKSTPPYLTHSPTPPEVVFGNGSLAAANPFSIDADGNPDPLRADRLAKVLLSPELFTTGGFGSLRVDNPDGNIRVPKGVTLNAPALGSITLLGANVSIDGDASAPGGTLNLTAYNISPSVAAQLRLTGALASPPANLGRGVVSVGKGSTLSAAGLIVDDRLSAPNPLELPLITAGGTININTFSADLAKGSTLDVSGGFAMNGLGKVTYGNGGSIVIKTGQDVSLPGVIGGKLNLESTLRGHAGITARGGSLTLQALLIQIGGRASYPGTFHIDPEFFNQGGFSTFTLNGIGAATDDPDVFIPGLRIASNTTINSQVESLVAVPHPVGPDTIGYFTAFYPESMRAPVSLNFGSLRVTDDFSSAIKVRGDLVLEQGAIVRTNPRGTVSLKGDTISLLGSVIAPGGSITVAGASSFPQNGTPTEEALTTVYLGPRSLLSTAGAVVLTPDAYGRRAGSVLPGGTINVSGNIAAVAGSTLDVSGTSGVLDFHPNFLGLETTPLVPLNSGINSPLYSRRTLPLRVDSNGGSIVLKGGQQLFVDSTLKGEAGGPTAAGGSLNVSSGRFYLPGVVPSPLDPTLVVTQHGPTLPAGSAGIGKPIVDSLGVTIPGMGYFAADSFLRGGFDSLTLGGTVQFSGPVNIDARNSITVGTAGVIYADSHVQLAAPYVALGQVFATPFDPKKPTLAFPDIPDSERALYLPTFGPGRLTVRAEQLDIGNLILKGIGKADFLVDGGDIRGNGTLNIAGDLTMRAAQIYPAAATTFTIGAYDYISGGTNYSGSVTIEGSGMRSLPLEAGGTLNIYGSIINQGGTLRAPLGTINLGWDGSGTVKDPITGLSVAVTKELNLLPGSITSVSGVDPITGQPVLFPYGYLLNGTSWIDPAGIDITNVGPPAKKITLGAQTINSQAGSTIEINGGGDLYAYRWIQGVGGSKDILASTTSFAVLPGYRGGVAPFGAFNTASPNFGGDPGYVNSSLKPGDTIYLDRSSSLPAGHYTLLPARFALLPGAVLVSPQSGAPIGTFLKPDGASLVSGYRYNTLSSERELPGVFARWEVAPAAVIRARSEYQDYFANAFFTEQATKRDAKVPRLPVDAGQLVFAATSALNLRGTVVSDTPIGGLGSIIDISSPGHIVIGGPNTTAPVGSLVLDSDQLSGFGAESLLIGGLRTFTSTGMDVSVKTNKLTLDNKGTSLTGADIILVANQELTLAQESSLTQTKTQSGSAEAVSLGTSGVAGSGDGLLVRVSSDPSAQVARQSVSSSTTPRMIVNDRAIVSGGSVTLDSTYGTSLNPTAQLLGQTINLNSGQISLLLDDPGVQQPTDGLVLAGAALQSLQSAKELSLLSYSSLDIYGHGQVGSFALENLAIHAAQIRGFNTGGGTAQFSAQTILLDNSTGRPGLAVLSPPTGSLVFDAGTIRLGAGNTSIDQYANISMRATNGIINEGSGNLNSPGNLTLTTPVLVGAAGSSKSITALGALVIDRPVGGGSGNLVGGLGARLDLTGMSVEQTSEISLPSGLVTIRATGGNVTIDGNIQAGGLAQTIHDAVTYTDGGRVKLISDTGNISVGSAATIDVGANAGGGNAGQLIVQAPQGSFTLDGTLEGRGGSGGKNGEFSLDVATISDLTSTNQTLNTAGFTASRDFRVRTGNVQLSGNIISQVFRLSADAGSVDVDGTINSSGTTGGTIALHAYRDLRLLPTAVLNAAGIDFNAAGQGGEIYLSTRGHGGGVLDLQTGSVINLSVAANNASSAGLGRFPGKLYLRAPQNAAGTDLLINPINSTIQGASSIIAEGYKIYDLTRFGGTITSTVQSQILADGQSFLGAAGSASAGYAPMANRLLANNGGLANQFVLSPGAEIINTAVAANAAVNLATVNSTLTMSALGGTIIFPSGTAGNNLVRSNVTATITSATGVVTALAANTPTAIAAGSTVKFDGSGVLTFASGSGGAIPLQIAPGAGTYTTSTTGASSVVSALGSTVNLNTAGTSSIALAAGTQITFPSGTPGTNRIRSTVTGTITSASGVVTALAANTSTAIAVGSTVQLNAPGTVSFASGGTTAGGIPVALAAGSFTTNGATSITPASGDLTLGTLASTTTSDWNLAPFRFGPKSAPGNLTLRASGNLVFFNALSDGFDTAAYNSLVLSQNTVLPTNTQSYSYTLTAGADFGAVDPGRVQSSATLGQSSGFLKIGKDAGNNFASTSGANATTVSAVNNRFQTIRTGTGNINVSAGRDVQFLNQFSTIYTAGVKVTDPTMGGNFDTPTTALLGGQGALGAVQQTTPYAAQYTFGGGNVAIASQGNILHLTRTNTGVLIDDSSRQLPNNWLYRRGAVDENGNFAPSASEGAEIASTTWWVDFSNFFEGVGALGGGNVSLVAEGQIKNVDAVVPTNARAPKGSAATSALLELGGGDLSIQAGTDINGGAYYVERGTGTLNAGGSILTNATRAPYLSSNANSGPLYSDNYLPTTLFVGHSKFDVKAREDLTLGPVANAFMLPGGYNNTYWYKSYFSTYASDSAVSASSLTGNLTFRQESTLPSGTSPTPLLLTWFKQVQLLTTNSISSFQPFLRLNESNVDSLRSVLALMPGNLRGTAFAGDINLVGDLTLSPSPSGTIDLLAAGAINGLQKSGYSNLGASGTTPLNIWTSSTINLSDANPLSIPGVNSPFSYQSVLGPNYTVASLARTSGANFLSFVDTQLDETGSTQEVLSVKQALHSTSILHADDRNPIRIYAGAGDIADLTLFSSKSARVTAQRDVTDIALYIQNTSEKDVSLVSSGRDIVAYNPNTPLRDSAQVAGNALAVPDRISKAGDIQISGPGTLQVLAGRHLDLGSGATNSDGTGAGLTSIGNGRNPSLTFAGANIIAGAGLGSAAGLSSSTLDFDGFISTSVTTENLAKYESELTPIFPEFTSAGFTSLPEEMQRRIALEVFYRILRDAGRSHNLPGDPNFGTYQPGLDAIASLFVGGTTEGDISTQARSIRTASGGYISLFAPGGKLTLATAPIAAGSVPPGIVTEAGGNISIFTDGNVDLGNARIFTLRGGNEIIWSSTGNIAAGSAAKTVASAPPTRVIIDPQSADVKTDLAGLATGGGIGVLNTVAGVEPGDVDLIAVVGSIDAGDAGIRSAGNLTLAAPVVLNASNIATSGTTTGAPAVAAPAPPPISAAPPPPTPKSDPPKEATGQTAPATKAQEVMDSLVTVEVIGYGGSGQEEDEDEEERKRRERELQKEQAETQ